MDSPTVNKIIETEEQSAQIIAEAHDKAAQIIDQAKAECEKIASDSKSKAAGDGDNLCLAAEKSGMKKADKIASDYSKKVSVLLSQAKANKQDAVKAAIDAVLSF